LQQQQQQADGFAFVVVDALADGREDAALPQPLAMRARRRCRFGFR
jgi:hypothetical protein